MKRSLLIFSALLNSAAMAQQPTLSVPEEISSLKWMVGTWTGKGPFAMMGTTMEMSVTMTCTLEGAFLKSVVSNDFGSMKMNETMYLWFDSEKKVYVSYSFTDMAPEPRVERGKMEGGKLVMVSQPWMGMVGRGTTSKTSDTKMQMTLEFQNETKWEKACDFALTKK